MQNTKLKNILRTAVSLLLVVAMIFGLNILFKPKWSTDFKSGTNIRGFYKMPDDSVELLVLGSSNVICGVNVNEMFETHGISAYICGTESQPVLGSYAWLQEACKSQNLKAVVFDVANLFGQPDEASYRKAFDYMHFSSLKLKMLQEYKSINPDMDMASYILPLILYHSRYTELSKEDFSKDTASLRGFYVRTAVHPVFPGIDPDGNEGETEIPDYNSRYFAEMVELCKENDISLILISTPSMVYTAQDHNAAQALADEYSLTFLDFNIKKNWPDLDYTVSMADAKHLNTEGASFLAEAIVAELSSMVSFTDYSNNNLFLEMDKEYKNALESSLAGKTTDAAAQ